MNIALLPLSQPDDASMETLVYFAALMHMRMPAFREHYLAQTSQHYEQIAEFSLAAPHAWERYLKQKRREGSTPIPRDKFERIRKQVLEDQVRIKIEAQPVEHLTLMARTLDHFARLLLRRTWSVVIAPENSGGFVTCDVPLALYWNFEGKDAAGWPTLSPAFGLADTEVFLPLSSRYGLVGRWADGMAKIETGSTVAWLNTKVINESARFIVSRDRKFSWLSFAGPSDGDGLEQRMRELRNDPGE